MRSAKSSTVTSPSYARATRSGRSRCAARPRDAATSCESSGSETRPLHVQRELTDQRPEARMWQQPLELHIDRDRKRRWAGAHLDVVLKGGGDGILVAGRDGGKQPDGIADVLGLGSSIQALEHCARLVGPAESDQRRVLERHHQRAAAAEVHGSPDARELLFVPPESVEGDGRLPEVENRVGIEGQPLVVEAQRLLIVAGHVVRHAGDATDERRERIVGDGFRRPARSLRAFAEQAAEIAHVDVGERIVRVAAERFLQIGARARPVRTQVELQLRAKVRDRGEVPFEERRPLNCFFRLRARQGAKPSCQFISCAVTRTRRPARRTLPWRTVATPSVRPIVASGSFFPLYEKAEARAATRNPDTCVSALMMSSVMPSLKYSL